MKAVIFDLDGVIFKRKQDPSNFTGLRCLFAPDVCKGVDGRYDVAGAKKKFKHHPYFRKNTGEYDNTVGQYLANMESGAVAGFKYFDFKSVNKISVEIGGVANGIIYVSTDDKFENVVAEIPVNKYEKKKDKYSACLEKEQSGTEALYFKFEGDGAIDFFSFELIGDSN